MQQAEGEGQAWPRLGSPEDCVCSRAVPPCPWLGARGSVPTPGVQTAQLGQQPPMCPRLFPTVRRQGQTVEAEEAPRH